MAKACENYPIQSNWDLSLENWTQYFQRQENILRYQLFMKVDSLVQLAHGINRAQPIDRVTIVKRTRFI